MDIQEYGLWKKFQENPPEPFDSKNYTPEKMRDMLNILCKKPKERIITCSAYYLLILSDEDFIHLWNDGSTEYKFYGGAETIKKINERAKQLNLVL